MGSEEGCPAGAIRALSLLAMWCSRCSLWWWDAAAAGHLWIFQVVGEKEQSNRTVNVRTRDNKVHGEFTLEAVSAKFTELATERIIKSEEHGWSEEVEVASEKSKSSTPMSD